MGDEYRYKIICDPIHGEIPISAVEQQLIDSPSFQRLRNLKQLGLASLVYPNATHSRFAHSLGVFRIMSRVIDLLVNKGQLQEEDKRKMRMAALLHDIGHYPYSHLMEFIDRDKYRPSLLTTQGASVSTAPVQQRYPDHEKIGQIVINQRMDVSSILNRVGINPEEIASIIRSEHEKAAYNRLIHSSLDMDRMDYLVRDSLGTGVPYGRIDLDYLLSNLDVADDGDVVVSSKASAAAEHFLVARYFMYKTVYMHKTTFGFEALLRHILFLLRERGEIYRDGKAIESMILTDDFLAFHDGYVDRKVQESAGRNGSDPIIRLCKTLQERKPPKLLHQVAVLRDASQGPNAEYAMFCQNRVDKIKQMAAKHGFPVEFWIWEDPKDVAFEALGPFVPISQAGDITPEETAELIRIRSAEDGSIFKLVDDPHSIIHHLSKLRLQMSRLYLAHSVEKAKLQEIKEEVKAWGRAN